MEVQQALPAPLVDPVQFEPVKRPARVAVEPHLGAFNGQTAGGLVHEGLRHKRHLVEVAAGRRNALHQVLAGFILAAEDVKVIRHAVPRDRQKVLTAEIFEVIAAGDHHAFQRRQHIPAEGSDGLPGHDEILTGEGHHRPDHEGQHHRDSLPGSDRSVRDDPVHVVVFLVLVPPVEEHPLLLGEGPELKRGRRHPSHQAYLPHRPPPVRSLPSRCCPPGLR